MQEIVKTAGNENHNPNFKVYNLDERFLFLKEIRPRQVLRQHGTALKTDMTTSGGTLDWDN